jgi:hypothetical protein
MGHCVIIDRLSESNAEFARSSCRSPRAASQHGTVTKVRNVPCYVYDSNTPATVIDNGVRGLVRGGTRW